MPEKNRFELQGLLPWVLTLGVLFIFLSISISQIILAAAMVIWILILIRTRQLPRFPAFFWALIAYAGLSLIACTQSDNPAVSFRDSKEMLLFLIVPMVYSGLRNKKEFARIHYAIFASAVLSIGFSLGYFIYKAEPGERIAGFMSHYMTQAGLLMLFSALALSQFFHARQKIRFIWGGGFALAAFALILTLTRNAWIGLLIVICVILLLYKPKVLIVVPVVLVLIFFIAPSPVKRRATSIFNPKSYSNAQRIEYLNAGMKIIKDYPVFGTGPNTVHVIFQKPKYGLSEEARANVHLHNNLVQIAAERGIPTMIVWGLFMVWAFISLAKGIRKRDPTSFQMSACALACVLAMFAAGMFEYNFGDSEVTTLFLFFITIPFVAARLQPGREPD